MFHLADVLSSRALAVSFSADSVCFSLLAFSSDGAGTADGTAGWSFLRPSLWDYL